MRIAFVVLVGLLGLWGWLRRGPRKWPRWASLGLLVVAAFAALELMPFSLKSRFIRAHEQRLELTAAPKLVTEADLQALPPAVRLYLRRVGVVGKPRVYNFRAKFTGSIRSGNDGPWMPFEAQQYSFIEPATRLFLIDASRGGIPFRAFHQFAGDDATMEVRVAELFTLVDARGPEMNRSETVTHFNDLWLLAPAALLDVDVTWLSATERQVECRFRRRGVEIGATLYFDEEGDLENFVSSDRFKSADGEHFENYPWATPLSDYKQFASARLWSRGDAIWREPGGDFTYGKFVLESIEYNVAE